MKTLVADEKKKNVLKAICREYTVADSISATSKKSSDVIPGKGEGRVFLLHGPPGVGKTLTAGKYRA